MMGFSEVISLLLLAHVAVGLPAETSDSSEDVGIVGGHGIDISQAPYQVSVQLNGYHICGGTIVGKNVVVSAAHCFTHSSNPSDYQIRAGSTYKAKGGQVVRVRQIISHPSYKENGNDYDIAVLKLSTPFQLSQNIAVVGMVNVGQEIVEGSQTTVTGWGALGFGGPGSPDLQMVNVPVVSHRTCASVYRQPISLNMLCAGVGGKDSCQGDSGGPLIYQNKLAGVVSFGAGCASPRYPGVYAKVSALRSWVDKVMR